MRNVYIDQINCVTPLGLDIEKSWEALLTGASGIGLVQRMGHFADFYAATIPDNYINPPFDALPDVEASFSRLEKMMILALAPILEGKKISSRTGLIISTTKGNIGTLKHGDITGAQLPTSAHRIAQYFGLETAPIIVSNACVSGLLAVMVGRRMMLMGRYDEVYVVAGDEVTEFVVSGFNSFQAMSSQPCRPYDVGRDGVTLGEAAAALSLSLDTGSIAILGDASINDANHISGPSRTGEGLYQSIKGALTEAGLTAGEVDCISAHGTATVYNDEMESIAIERMNLSNVPVNSLKGNFGHTLGCSGLLELVMLAKSLSNNIVLPTKGLYTIGVTGSMMLPQERSTKLLTIGIKTASGFGGSNAAMVLRKVGQHA